MTDPTPALSRTIKAEAAAWLARLRSEDRGPEDEAAFRAWLAEDARHAAAFDLVTNAWEMVGGLTHEVAVDEPVERTGMSRRTVLAGVAAMVAVGSGYLYQRGAGADHYATQLGEQRRVTLADGSAVTLDTETEIRVAFHDDRREIELLRGRAHFDVAKDAARPFRVTAGGREVVAIGTAFDVARREDEVAVLLVEGRIAVRSPGVAAAYPRPGERIVIDRANAIHQERPDVQRATAWQVGRVIFDDQPLAAAVAEMNRYNRKPLVVTDAELGALRVSGTYSTGDSEAFARSIASLLPVAVHSTPQQILIEPLAQESEQSS
ncbi:FecR family protein [Sphingomonas laterariae]|uniref:FecR family protein n=1 Tax=Edaphosphingomonas laterariae TaxID=861865 RepID=A0A239DRK1_9SPHN|nr:FecR family protein [Sphingomonas laterariae]SNS35146.1 FecR family protein [Sphingomonas laterariae]